MLSMTFTTYIDLMSSDISLENVMRQKVVGLYPEDDNSQEIPGLSSERAEDKMILVCLWKETIFRRSCRRKIEILQN